MQGCSFRSAAPAFAVAIAVATTGCPPAEFRCATDEQCARSASGGFCERTGYCSFADATCASSGRSYGPYAGALSSTCVDGVALVVTADGNGRVTSSPAGIDCPGRCSSVFDGGTPIQLTPVPGVRSYMTWSGACRGTATECALVMDAPRDVTASFREANYVFVSSATKRPGDLGGLAGADALCSELAGAAGLPGRYVAWLSTRAGVNAIDRIAGPNPSTPARGWIRPDGKPVVDSINDIVTGRFFYPIRLDENQHDVADDGALVVTGTHPNGRNTDSVGSALTALDWDDPQHTTAAAAGFADAGREDWTDTISSRPPDPAHIYCFGVDLANEVVVDPTPRARVAFLYGGTNVPAFFPNATGIADADGRCAQQAASRDLDGSYHALIATTQQSAIARIGLDTNGLPWARPDGVFIVAQASDLTTGSLIAPLDVFVDLGYAANLLAWTGAPTPDTAGGSDDTTCRNWTDATLPRAPLVGRTTRSSRIAFDATGGTSLACSTTNGARLYCLQD